MIYPAIHRCCAAHKRKFPAKHPEVPKSSMPDHGNGDADRMLLKGFFYIFHRQA